MFWKNRLVLDSRVACNSNIFSATRGHKNWHFHSLTIIGHFRYFLLVLPLLQQVTSRIRRSDNTDVRSSGRVESVCGYGRVNRARVYVCLCARRNSKTVKTNIAMRWASLLTAKGPFLAELYIPHDPRNLGPIRRKGRVPRFIFLPVVEYLQMAVLLLRTFNSNDDA